MLLIMGISYHPMYVGVPVCDSAHMFVSLQSDKTKLSHFGGLLGVYLPRRVVED